MHEVTQKRPLPSDGVWEVSAHAGQDLPGSVKTLELALRNWLAGEEANRFAQHQVFNSPHEQLECHLGTGWDECLAVRVELEA